MSPTTSAHPALSHRDDDRQKSGKRCRPVPEFFQLSLPRSTLRCSRSVTAPAFHCGRRRLRFRAHSRHWREVAQTRPLVSIAPSPRLRARHRRLCRASPCADSSLHSRRSPALRSAPARQPRSLMGEGNFSRAAPSSQPSHTLRDADGGTCAGGLSSAQAPPSVHTSRGEQRLPTKSWPHPITLHCRPFLSPCARNAARAPLPASADAELRS